MKKLTTFLIFSLLLLSNSVYASEDIQSQINQIDQEIEALKIKRQELVGQLENGFDLDIVGLDLKITAEDVQLKDDMLYIFWYFKNDSDGTEYPRKITDGSSGWDSNRYHLMQVNPREDLNIYPKYNPTDVAIGEYLSKGEFDVTDWITPGKEVRYYTTYPLHNTEDPVHIYVERFNPYHKAEYIIDLVSLQNN